MRNRTIENDYSKHISHIHILGVVGIFSNWARWDDNVDVMEHIFRIVLDEHKLFDRKHCIHAHSIHALAFSIRTRFFFFFRLLFSFFNFRIELSFLLGTINGNSVQNRLLCCRVFHVFLFAVVFAVIMMYTGAKLSNWTISFVAISNSTYIFFFVWSFFFL